MSNKITSISAKACPIIGENIDTDQIIPARYLTATTFNGIEKGLFYDLRFDKDNNSLGFLSDDNKYKNHEIYFVNANFGCGSSREHAPQAIKRSGIKALIGVSFSEIFFGNSISMGLCCFRVSVDVANRLQQYTMDNPNTIFTIDIKNLILKYDNKEEKLELSSQIQELFLNGTYDPLAVLLDNKDKIIEFEKTIVYR
jgi:3-isopropylmalate/(R)-2-methylmalate dehydratase small subunit